MNDIWRTKLEAGVKAEKKEDEKRGKLTHTREKEIYRYGEIEWIKMDGKENCS